MFFKPFPLPTEPVIPQTRVCITDFGALPDGKTDAKPAIDAAIAAIAAQGGGHVVIPRGDFFCDGPVHFVSKMDLHLEEGARLIFTDRKEAYLPVVFTRIEGIRCYNYSPLLYGIDLEDISVTGSGTLYGNGMNWWHMHKGVHAYSSGCGSVTDRLHRMGQENTPLEERIFGTEEDNLRPYFLQFVRCKTILIEGVRFEESPFWTVAPLFSENITIRGVHWYTDLPAHNTDSVDIDSCRRVLVENCVVESSADDSFCVKSGRDRDGREAGVPTEDVLVRNCEMHNAGGSMVVGSETSGGIRNICFRDCTVDNCGNVVNVKSAPGRGNVIENVDFINIRATRVIKGVSISLHYFVTGEEQLTDMPVVRNIYVEGVTVGNSWHGLYLQGYKGYPVDNIVLRDIDINAIETDVCMEYAENVSFDRVAVHRSREFFRWQETGGIVRPGEKK